jgi:tRNA (guanine37-N1)-methyltransferase
VEQKEPSALRFDILTLFPDMFPPLLEASILGIAQSKGRAEYHLHDIRDYSEDKHRKVDDRPYGGGPGMVMACQPVFDCYEAVRQMDEPPGRLLLLTPKGRPFDQAMAAELSAEQRLVLLCGRYEGFDQRIHDALPGEEVSLGDFVLSGGEIAAMAIVDATVRLVPGVLGHEDSAEQDSFSSGLLDHPHYTRPAEFRGMTVPEVLLSGDHGRIEQWRAEQARKRTQEARADLIDRPTNETEAHDG